MKKLQERQIEIGNATVNCQILNWQSGPPPKYIVCNVLEGAFAGTEIIATQMMGAWMRIDLCSVLRHYHNHYIYQEVAGFEDNVRHEVEFTSQGFKQGFMHLLKPHCKNFRHYWTEDGAYNFTEYEDEKGQTKLVKWEDTPEDLNEFERVSALRKAGVKM